MRTITRIAVLLSLVILLGTYVPAAGSSEPTSTANNLPAPAKPPSTGSTKQVAVARAAMEQPLAPGDPAMGPDRLQAAATPANRRPAPSSTHYSDEYVAAHRGRVSIEVPEAYELAVIATALTNQGRAAPHRFLVKEAYYQRVMAHFLPYKNHPLVARINFGEDRVADSYAFRENSMAYVFDGDRLEHGGVYANIWDPNLFEANLDMVEDFARVSGFREFYHSNHSFYSEQIREYRSAVEAEKMWSWLEDQFPYRHGSYKIIFSPLINFAHSTQRYEDNGLTETVMFVAGPDAYGGEAWGPGEQAMMAQQVFKEMERNYLNPVANAYAGRIRSVMADLDRWYRPPRQDTFSSPQAMFNEYMAAGVYVLYAQDTYVPALATDATERTITFMVEQRQFVKFYEFRKELMRLYKARQPEERVVDLYPRILDWIEKQK